ncbi:MAG: hypothetical protein LBU34_09565 [Planctomycetaceae bacterium]|jgi:hypothetical protein|nr:hypothetical protein [Planctomycetaceae bacterium]
MSVRIVIRTVISVFFVLSFLLTGCPNKTKTEPVTLEKTPEQIETLNIPYPTAEILEQLGSENNLESRWLLPDPIFVIAGQPKRFLESPIGKGNENLLSEIISQLLQVPFVPVKIDRFVQASAFPAQIQVTVEQNGVPVPQMRLVYRRSTILAFDEPIKKEELFKSIFGDATEDIESKKRQSGTIEYYDLALPEITTSQRLALAFADERTLVVVEGQESDIKAVFEQNQQLPAPATKNAAIERLKRLDLDSNDLLLVTSLEGVSISPQVLEDFLFQTGVPQNLAESLVKHLRAATLFVNLTVPVNSPMMTIRLDSRDSQGAVEIGEITQGVILLGQTTLATIEENAKMSLPVPYEFAKSVLNAVTVNIADSRVDVVLNKFEKFEETASAGIRNQQTTMQQMQIQQQRVEQMLMLGQIFMAYYKKNNQFPTDIRSADGVPLLSWRVAVLPMLGLEELYNKFKLDEAWDSPTNEPLQKSMPSIFRPLADNIKPPKTIIRFFDSEGTPFANPNLKPEELKNPQSTLMFVSVHPEKAVEWTKPETLAFDADKLEEIIGSSLFGLTFSGQILPDIPVIPLSDPRSKQQRYYLESIVKGLPLPEPPADLPELPQESAPVVPSAGESTPATALPTVPTEAVPTETVPAETVPAETVSPVTDTTTVLEPPLVIPLTQPPKESEKF